MKNQKHTYKSLKSKMSFNKKQLEVLKKTVLVLGTLFIALSFVLFYSTSILINVDIRISLVFTAVLCLLFISLVGVFYYRKHIEKETNEIDMEIYKLLRLRI